MSNHETCARKRQVCNMRDHVVTVVVCHTATWPGECGYSGGTCTFSEFNATAKQAAKITMLGRMVRALNAANIVPILSLDNRMAASGAGTKAQVWYRGLRMAVGTHSARPRPHRRLSVNMRVRGKEGGTFARAGS